MQIPISEVEKIAALSRLSFNEAEKKQFQHHLEEVLKTAQKFRDARHKQCGAHSAYSGRRKCAARRRDYTEYGQRTADGQCTRARKRVLYRAAGGGVR